jgi:hypothetical protein
MFSALIYLFLSINAHGEPFQLTQAFDSYIGSVQKLHDECRTETLQSRTSEVLARGELLEVEISRWLKKLYSENPIKYFFRYSRTCNRSPSDVARINELLKSWASDPKCDPFSDAQLLRILRKATKAESRIEGCEELAE